MNKLLERVLEAHGGFEQWKPSRVIEPMVLDRQITQSALHYRSELIRGMK